MTKLEQALRLVHDNSTRHDWPDDIWNAIEEALAEPTMRKTTRDEKIVRPGVYEVPGQIPYGRPGSTLGFPKPEPFEQDAFAYQKLEQAEQEPSCNQHPDAPHGFDRNASHNAGRYVCECESWEPEQAEQEPVGYVPQSVIDWLSSDERTDGAYSSINLYKNPCGSSDAPLYTAPVRTKDLTDDEIARWSGAATEGSLIEFARAVIAADREKNNVK